MSLAEKDFEELARRYIWEDYVNANNELEEVQSLVALLKRVYDMGKAKP